MREQNVLVAIRWGDSLATREAATAILQEYPSAHLLVLDFTGVEFISRSFADQLVKETAARRATGRLVECCGLRPIVQDMLDTVKRTQQPIARKWDNIQVLEFPSTKGLLWHLQTL